MGFRRSMKPLESAPLTSEDLQVWWHVLIHWDLNMQADMFYTARWADERDAALMRAWAQGWPIDLGGEDEEGECLFWSGARRAMRVTV